MKVVLDRLAYQRAITKLGPELRDKLLDAYTNEGEVKLDLTPEEMTLVIDAATKGD